jgi:hypothetical protein
MMTTHFRLLDRHQADILQGPEVQLPHVRQPLLPKVALGSSPGLCVGLYCTVVIADPTKRTDSV